MAIILSGERKAKRILRDLSKQAKGKRLKLVVVQVGSNMVSASYIGEKQKAAEIAGIKFELVQLPVSISQKKIEDTITKLGKDSRNTGIIVQLPLPKELKTQDVLNRIIPEKDVDLLSSAAFGMFTLGHSKILPPTVAAIVTLLKGQSLKEKKVVVVGAGRLVGIPASIWLLQEQAQVSIIDKKTKDKAMLFKQADIIISGVGKKDLIKGSMIKRGAVVIDAGTSVENGTASGDVDFTSVVAKAKAVTPVPGGVGPLTVSHLLRNLVILSS